MLSTFYMAGQQRNFAHAPGLCLLCFASAKQSTDPWFALRSKANQASFCCFVLDAKPGKAKQSSLISFALDSKAKHAPFCCLGFEAKQSKARHKVLRHKAMHDQVRLEALTLIYTRNDCSKRPQYSPGSSHTLYCN